MRKFSTMMLAGAIALGGVGALDTTVLNQSVEAAELNGITGTVKDAGATIVLKLTNNTSSITRSDVVIQQLYNGEWVEPDFYPTWSILYPEAGWNYEELYYLKGPGGEIPSAGTYRFKVTTTAENTEDLGTFFTDSFTVK